MQERSGQDAALTSVIFSAGSHIDLMIAEGFKSSGAPKVLVLGDLSETGPLSNVIATVNGDGGPWGCPR